LNWDKKKRSDDGNILDKTQGDGKFDGKIRSGNGTELATSAEATAIATSDDSDKKISNEQLQRYLKMDMLKMGINYTRTSKAV